MQQLFIRLLQRKDVYFICINIYFVIGHFLCFYKLQESKKKKTGHT